jgi:hypothetical protein
MKWVRKAEHVIPLAAMAVSHVDVITGHVKKLWIL